jgi:phosphohistidine phosphatase
LCLPVVTLASPSHAHYDPAMRKLLLLRHAKTERTNLAGDHARKLVVRGREDAVHMGAFLQRERLAPQQAFVSDAARTRETFAQLSSSLDRQPDAQFEGTLYLAAAHQILDVIRTAPEDCDALLVIGHNPGIHQLAYDLGQRGPHKLVTALAAKFPTCALAVIDCDISSWNELQASNCHLTRYMTAKALRVHEVADFDDDC